MRTHPIYCDWCGELITETLIVYSNEYLKPHGTYEGARHTFDFCSDEHLTAWQDGHAMRRLTQQRTGRIGGADVEGAAEYRAQLENGLDARIAEALSGPRRPS